MTQNADYVGRYEVSSTWRWANGNVMTFGLDGEQIFALQGPWSTDLAERIHRHSTPDTEWHGWGEDGPCIWPAFPDGRSEP